MAIKVYNYRAYLIMLPPPPPPSKPLPCLLFHLFSDYFSGKISTESGKWYIKMADMIEIPQYLTVSKHGQFPPARLIVYMVW